MRVAHALLRAALALMPTFGLYATSPEEVRRLDAGYLPHRTEVAP
jgi:hypothetical protein